MEFVKNEHKEFFLETYKFLKELDKFLYDSGAGHLFTEKQLRKLKYAGEADQISNYAYPLIKPVVDIIIDFANKSFLNDNPPIKLIATHLISNKCFGCGSKKGNTEEMDAVKLLTRLIKEYLENPTKLAKGLPKLKDPVKPGINQSRLKKPRVFTLKDKDEFVKPNQETYDALCKLNKFCLELQKATIMRSIDNKNPTKNYADRMHVSMWEELDAYKQTRVLIKKDDDYLRDKSKEILKILKSYFVEETTPLKAEILHRKTMFVLNAFKGTLKKFTRKQELIELQLQEQNKDLESCLTPTNPIVEKKGRSK